MATIHVDGNEYEVDGADNLLQACLSLGLDIPYFCWHPALGSVGACRQCAVKQYQNADDTRGRLVMSCMTPASDGTYIAIEDEEAKAFRQSVVEWLMLNHPHDCPVCAEGGHCHLQDMTVMAGHHNRHYRFSKRTHQNQDLGPFIAHEMNRCIACYRCVRYYQDYAGGTDLGVYGAHDNLYFGRVEEGTLESEFSGNLVEVCPTGVFTDKTHAERYNRKWDMQFAPSICQQCSLGCNISPGERYGELRRIENRYHGAINRYFLCDRGRFGYGYVNRRDRPRQAWRQQGGERQPLAAIEAINWAADRLRQVKRIIGIGSPRASLESNFSLRELVGEDNFFSGVEAGEWERQQWVLRLLRESGLPTPSLRDVEQADAILVLGEDLTQTAARLALAVRQAVQGKARARAAALKVEAWQQAAIQTLGQQDRHPLFLTATDETRLDALARRIYRAAPEEQARLALAVAQRLAPELVLVNGLSEEQRALASDIAEALTGARRPLIIAGTGAGSEALLQAAGQLALTLKARGQAVDLSLVVPEANSLGLALLGGNSLEAALAELEEGRADALLVLENDLYHRLAAPRVQAALARPDLLLVLDHQSTATLEQADLALPAASFAEGDGTLVSQEGRAQRFFQVYEPTSFDPNSQVRESWRWLHALDSSLNHRQLDWGQLDERIRACAEAVPALAGMLQAAPDAGFRIKRMKLARSPNRYSGRTALRANHNVHEPRVPQDIDSAFAFSMEGFAGSSDSNQQIPFAWAPGWNSPQAWNKFQDEVGGHLRAGDPGVRLFTPPSPGRLAPLSTSVAPFRARDRQWQLVAYHRLFGSEELSQRSPVIQQRMPPAELVLNPGDARLLALQAGNLVAFSWQGQHFRFPLRLSETLPPGLVALPLGFPGLPTGMLGAWIQDLQEAML